MATGVQQKLSAERASREDLIALLPRLIEFPQLFPDTEAPCPEYCGACGRCHSALISQFGMMRAPDARTYLLRRGDEIVALVYFTNVTPTREAQLHGLAFDGTYQDKGPLVRRLCDEQGVRRVWAAVPAYAKGLGDWLQSLGFRQMQLRRRAVPWKGDWHDVAILEYGSHVGGGGGGR